MNLKRQNEKTHLAHYPNYLSSSPIIAAKKSNKKSNYTQYWKSTFR